MKTNEDSKIVSEERAIKKELSNEEVKNILKNYSLDDDKEDLPLLELSDKISKIELENVNIEKMIDDL